MRFLVASPVPVCGAIAAADKLANFCKRGGLRALSHACAAGRAAPF